MDAQRCVEFWEQDQLRTIKPVSARFGEWPEGWNAHDFLRRTLLPFVGDGTVVEIGCGYGRLSGAFEPDKYIGLDINRHAIERARILRPEYRFQVTDFAAQYPPSDLRLLYTVLLHVPDELIDRVVHNVCIGTRYVAVVESLGRHGRRQTTTPVFLRDREDYARLFAACGFVLEEEVRRAYHYYPGWELSLLLLRRRHPAPSGLAHFPGDLSDPDLQYAGLYDDGWLTDRAHFVLRAEHGARLSLEGFIPLIDNASYTTTLDISIGPSRLAHHTLGVGEFAVNLALPDQAVGEVRVNIEFTSVQRLPRPDDREISAFLRSIRIGDSSP